MTDPIKKQMLDELVDAAEDLLQNCPGCAGIDGQLDFDYFVLPSPGDPPGAVIEPAGCVCSRLRKAVKEYQAYDAVSP